MRPDPTVVAGSTCADHTPLPDGYVDRQERFVELLETHRQRRCAECGLWRIWVAR